MYKALILENAGGFRARVAELEQPELTQAKPVLVRVRHSCLNYKDALAITNRAPVVRNWPMVAGIDCAGVVERSDSPEFPVGSEVILNGWGAGEVHWGGLAELALLDSKWLVPKPAALSSYHAMSLGTAGYTAMLCVMALARHGIAPADGEILVTGATGGVGSVAVSLLAKRGYAVVASTGKAEEHAYLERLGAKRIIDRASLSQPGKPLQKEVYAGAIDCVGSTTLANVCAQLKYGGAVAACGLAQGMDLPASVAPFILRGITLYGIDSVMAPQARRREAWSLLAAEIDTSLLELMTTRVDLAGAIPTAATLLEGKVRGRIVVDM